MEGYSHLPSPSCSNLPIPVSVARDVEVKRMSLFYTNNLCNSFLYRVSRVPSPLCSDCGLEHRSPEFFLSIPEIIPEIPEGISEIPEPFRKIPETPEIPEIPEIPEQFRSIFL